MENPIFIECYLNHETGSFYPGRSCLLASLLFFMLHAFVSDASLIMGRLCGIAFCGT